MHVILNLAAGGAFVGRLLPLDEDLPAWLEIDYVRVYQMESRILDNIAYLPAVTR